VKRTQFTFYEEYYTAISKVKSKRVQLSLFEAVCDYALDGIEPNLTGEAKRVFAEIFPQLKKERRQSIEGRRSSEYVAWRKAVYERDKHTCQKCGERGGRLNAHHIKPYAIYVDLRYSVPNGITLCESCHKNEHRKKVCHHSG
jgi:hypothetical protein